MRDAAVVTHKAGALLQTLSDFSKWKLIPMEEIEPSPAIDHLRGNAAFVLGFTGNKRQTQLRKDFGESPSGLDPAFHRPVLFQ